jgi:peptide/nickel transport system permease protein
LRVFLLHRIKTIIILFLKNILLFLIAIVGTHGLAFLLIQILPTTAEIMLGFYGIQHDVLVELSKLTTPRSYPEMLSGLAILDFGVSADGVSVSSELSRHFLFSLPRLGLALFFAAVAALVASSIAGRLQQGVLPTLSYILFFPLYGIPFFLFVLLLAIGARIYSGSITAWFACTVAIAIPPSALLASQAYASTKNHLESQHAINFLSMGISPSRLRHLLMRNLVYEIVPTFEKVMTGAVTGLMFSELVFGMPGMGALAIRAIRRADIELLLGVVVVFASLICLARLFSVVVLSFYRTSL